jgi:tetratricopeptide (TPR) repeat protein
MPRTRLDWFGTWSTLAVAFALWAVPWCAAQEIEWRFDYNTARKEAIRTNRPILIDFGTESCTWCKRLDVTTFRDPAVASLLNERFVPLKIDAERDAPLAAALRVRNYPTIVLALADGKIMEFQEGYLEGPQLTEKLRGVLASQADPEWMLRDYDAASKAVSAADYARALGLLKHLVEDGGQRPVQTKARGLLSDLEQQAAGQFARARQQVDRGQTTEAVATFTDLVRLYPGTQAAREGGQMLVSLGGSGDAKGPQRTTRARELLAQAREEFRTQQYFACLTHCESLQTGYADLAEAAEAGQLAGEIKNNPEWLKLAADSLSDQLGGVYLAMADGWVKKGQPQQAIACLERLVQTLPGTRQAEEAQARLAQLQATVPARAVGFPK